MYRERFFNFMKQFLYIENPYRGFSERRKYIDQSNEVPSYSKIRIYKNNLERKARTYKTRREPKCLQ